MSPDSASPTYFTKPGEFRRWLDKHHATATELIVGFYRKDTGQPTMTWTESVREALCFGWVDGHVKRLDDHRYTRRFTPRTRTSIWSAVNMRHAESLIAEGRMQPAGLAAYEARTANRSGVYSFELGSLELPADYRKHLQDHKKAATFWDEQPASYRKAAIWWIVSAKLAPTRLRRLEALIDHSTKGERIPQFVSTSRKR